MADQLCDLLGLDTISCGATIGFAFDLYENGILTKSDTDGLELTWGNHEAMVALIKKIAAREGIGDILAEGSKGAAEKIGKGAEYYAMHCKGVELPAYDPRGAKSQGYSYATSNVGGIHGYGYAYQEIFGAPFPRPVDRFAETENADIVVHNQNGGALTETGINCVFATSWVPFPMLYGKMLTAATGIEKFSDPGYLMHVGERIVNLERAFNMREGFSRKDDYLPERLRTEPLIAPDRASDGQLVRESDAFLDKYYALRGWDSNGVPTQEKLKALDIDPI